MVNIHEMFENQFNVCKSTQTSTQKKQPTFEALKTLSTFDACVFWPTYLMVFEK